MKIRTILTQVLFLYGFIFCVASCSEEKTQDTPSASHVPKANVIIDIDSGADFESIVNEISKKKMRFLSLTLTIPY